MIEPRPLRDDQRILVRLLSNTELAPAIELFDSAYRQFAGPVDRRHRPRTAGSVDRPGTPRQHFLAEVEGVPVGAAAFTVGGDVAEWAVPEGPHAEATAIDLLRAGEAWARENGASEILFYLAHGSIPRPEQLMRLGYRELTPPKTVMQVVHFQLLLQQFADIRQAALAPVAPRTLLIHLEPGLYPPLLDPDLTITITPETTRVTAGATPSPQIRVETTATHYSEFIFGGRSFDGLLAEGLTVTPAPELPVARTVLTALTTGRPWFTPLGEHR